VPSAYVRLHLDLDRHRRDRHAEEKGALEERLPHGFVERDAVGFEVGRAGRAGTCNTEAEADNNNEARPLIVRSGDEISHDDR
jgi:hypothetical protein